MYGKRSNPWPALVDLFAALLISTFAGLVVIGAVGETRAQASKEKDRQLRGKEAELATLNRSIEEQRREFQALEELRAKQEVELTRAQKRLETLEDVTDRQRLKLERLHEGRGIDDPPCMAQNGRPIPLIEVEVLDKALRVTKAPIGGHAELIQDIPGLTKITTVGRISDAEFREFAAPVFRWAKNPDNALGFACSFYTRIAISTDSPLRLASVSAQIQKFFYLMNGTEVNQFIIQRSQSTP